MRTIVFGFLFFLFTIVLVLQFISVGMAIMADRYSYLPFIGLLFVISILYAQWFEKAENTGASAIIKKTIPFITIVFALIFCVTTYARCKVWKDNQSLWTDVIKIYPEAAIAYKNRGVDLVENQQYDLALADFNSYLKIVHDDGSVYSNRANIYGLKHEYNLALADYSQAIALEKNKSSEAYLNRGITYSMMKIYDKAMLDYDKALSKEPRSIAVFQNRGYVLIEMKEYQKAIENFNQLIALTQNDFNAYFYRGLAYYNLSEYQKSIDDNTASIALNPSYGSAYQNRAICYNQLGNYKNALADALKAKELGAPLDAFIETLRSKQ